MQTNTTKTPLLSVIVPVHNCGLYLRDMLDTLVFQTLEEIEIIIIENGSTDNTYEIMEEYAEKYPNKVIIKKIPPVTTSAEGRSLGVKMARADYIYSCDGDDLADYRALEKMYNLALSGDYDIVGGRDCSYSGINRKISKNMNQNPSIERYIIDQTPAFWSRLVKKELYEQMGDVPTEIPLSDVAYILPMSSFAKKIGFLKYPPIYHYFRRNGSEINSSISASPLDIISANRLALNTCNPQYREEIMYHLAIRLNNEYRSRWMYRDAITERIIELWSELSTNKYLIKAKNTYEKLSSIAATSSIMNRIVYLNGFNEASDIVDVMNSRKIPAFWNGVRYIVLDETNCDISQNKYIEKLYKSGDLEGVAVYFALLQIQQTGGFYLNRNVQIDVPLNSLRICKNVFGYVDSDTFSDWFWGAQPNSEIVQSLINTYADDSIYNQRKFRLFERMKNILWIQYGIQPNGITHWEDFGTTLLGPEVIMCQTYTCDAVNIPLHFCSHLNYSVDNSIEIIHIPRTTMSCIAGIAGGLQRHSSYELEEYRTLKDSDTYKVIIFLKRLANGPCGPFFRLIFNGLLGFKSKFIKLLRR